MDPFIQKIQDQRINDKYSLVRKLGEGGYGSVWLGCDFDTGEEVALKLDRDTNSVDEEYDAYSHVQALPGFPKVYWCGSHYTYRVLALELLGPSLADVFSFCEHRFSHKTTLLIADQLLERLEALHTKGYVHRDVKPENCLLGTGENGNLIYITDFGLVREFSRGAGDVSERTRLRLVGTARYASIDAHYDQRPCARDDLESLGYMLIYFMRGKLPWQGLRASNPDEKHYRIVEEKLALSIEELCTGLPEQFAEYMTCVDSYGRNQTPDYNELRGIFRTLADQEGIEYDNAFDWTVRMFLHQLQQSEIQVQAQDIQLLDQETAASPAEA